MSLAATNWAKTQNTGDATTKAVLVALADFANKDGFAWPSQETLAERTGYTSRTVRKALRLLEERNFIARQKRGSAVRRARIADLILLGMPVKQPAQKDTLTGISRHPYRNELPGNISVKGSKSPSQVEKLPEGYTSRAIGGSDAYDPGSNVVPFPVERDVA